ncbi:MAG: 4'-phosphopantetheinyl transferase superfamily protein [Lysobacter sp.]|nr:4'-phosphopantetheinyl transferase superfamily protein [Lysobacter sp.]
MPPKAEQTDATPDWAWQALPRGVPAEPFARAWLGARLGSPAEALPILRDARGRPQLDAPFQGYDCNWSHSGEGLLVALGQGLQVGVDLEWLRPRKRVLELAGRWFTAHEASWLAELDPVRRDRTFLRLWCAKEAVLKAHGYGPSFGLDRIGFGERSGILHLLSCDPALGPAEEWSLLEIEPAPGYIGALAWRHRQP